MKPSGRKVNCTVGVEPHNTDGRHVEKLKKILECRRATAIGHLGSTAKNMTSCPACLRRRNRTLVACMQKVNT